MGGWKDVKVSLGMIDSRRTSKILARRLCFIKCYTQFLMQQAPGYDTTRKRSKTYRSMNSIIVDVNGLMREMIAASTKLKTRLLVKNYNENSALDVSYGDKKILVIPI